MGPVARGVAALSALAHPPCPVSTRVEQSWSSLSVARISPLPVETQPNFAPRAARVVPIRDQLTITPWHARFDVRVNLGETAQVYSLGEGGSRNGEGRATMDPVHRGLLPYMGRRFQGRIAPRTRTWSPSNRQASAAEDTSWGECQLVRARLRATRARARAQSRRPPGTVVRGLRPRSGGSARGFRGPAIGELPRRRVRPCMYARAATMGPSSVSACSRARANITGSEWSATREWTAEAWDTWARRGPTFVTSRVRIETVYPASTSALTAGARIPVPPMTNACKRIRRGPASRPTSFQMARGTGTHRAVNHACRSACRKASR